MGKPAESISELAQKILSLVEADTNGGCWLWPRSVNARGYGQISYHFACKKTHRVVFEHFNGKIPEGMVVCHKCDVTACCNPNHLFLGTQSENIKDCANKGRHREHRYEKITYQAAKEIFWAVRSGKSHRQVAGEHGCEGTTVNRIARGRHRHSQRLQQEMGDKP